MIAIGLLFVRMLCDCFKSRRRLEAEIWHCGISSMSCSSARRIQGPDEQTAFLRRTKQSVLTIRCCNQTTDNTDGRPE
jgi:hypothetical protein